MPRAIHCTIAIAGVVDAARCMHPLPQHCRHRRHRQGCGYHSGAALIPSKLEVQHVLVYGVDEVHHLCSATTAAAGKRSDAELSETNGTSLQPRTVSRLHCTDARQVRRPQHMTLRALTFKSEAGAVLVIDGEQAHANADGAALEGAAPLLQVRHHHAALPRLWRTRGARQSKSVQCNSRAQR
jgi:hypothetical protein